MGFHDEPHICEEEEFKQALMSNNQSSRVKVETYDGVLDDDKHWGQNKKLNDERKSSTWPSCLVARPPRLWRLHGEDFPLAATAGRGIH